jgi:hypothetical protein
MARALRWLLAGLLAIPVVVIGASPCLACSCAAEPLRARLAHADVAFEGRVTDSRAAPAGTIQVLAVDGVYQGDLPPEVELFAQIGQGVVHSCAVLLPTGSTVGVVADRNDDGTYSTNVCLLTTPASLARALGPARPPSASPREGPPAAPAATDAPIGLPAWLVAVLGALGGLVLIGGTVAAGPRLAACRERRARPAPDADEPAGA